MRKKTIYYYSVYDKEPTMIDRFEWESIWLPHDIEYVAEEIAEQYFVDSSYEASFPLDIYIWDDKHEYIGGFHIVTGVLVLSV
jgi:hypothetical protein